MNMEFDYIIIGAGSAGSVLANRLSANPKTAVLLVESGPDDNSPLIAMPRGLGKMSVPGNPHMFEYDVSLDEKQTQEHWMRGRAIGGSSSTNGMVYVRGTPKDYDDWEAQGCTGWGWNQIGKRFVELEDHVLGADEWRGAGGPLKVSVHPSGNVLCEALLDSAAALGVPRVPDVNQPEAASNGAMGYQTQTTWKGKRFSASRAFLTKEVRNRPNLKIVTGTNALRIHFEGKRATAVTLNGPAGEGVAKARREIILSAGAYESPKLLQLSGVGPADLLTKLGIPVVADSPNVGAHLLEHRFVSLQFKVKTGSLNSSFMGLGLIRSVLDYLLFSKGPLSHAAHEAGGFVKTQPGLDRPDAQIGVGLYSFGLGDDGKMALDPFPGLTLIGYYMRPKSEGSVRITSADPTVAPDIQLNHFGAEEDREAAVSLMKWMRKLAQQEPLKSFIVEETRPGRSIATDEDIIANLIQLGGPTHHSCGTCRMGVDEGAVLDPQLRVRGVEGLRVIDTSMMPAIISGNTNGPAMVIAMNAADMILKSAK